MDGERRPNRLATQASPYLLQHAFNPVDWYPWGAEALDRARREDRPILLSIGYAACHWCHVMERESFEDPATAAIMNEHFVCVKVDREERPDLDAVYMEAVQAMTGRGGWPMTVFLTPEGNPFFAGTYFPDQARHGIPAFRDVLAGVAEAWREQRDRVNEEGGRVAHAIARTAALRQSEEPLSEHLLSNALGAFRGAFDPEWGGFGPAPKFPQPMSLEFLIRCHLRGWDGALEMVTLTLDHMAAGGIHDQVGGGFHRYSVDGRWHVPHFEKMLYDNAQLARVYLHAWQVTGQDRYRSVAMSTLDYLQRELRHGEGGFFSSQDADSEGVEGKYYVWSWGELVDVGGDAVATYLGAAPSGNWDGSNVLWTPVPPDRIAGGVGMAPADLQRRTERTLERLHEVRGSRIRPSTDDKILTGWNGLAISAFAEAGRSLGEARYVDAAASAADFVLTRLRRTDGRLLRSWREGSASAVTAYLDDYALMTDALLTVYETTFDARFFQAARELASEMVRLFVDPERGGFFQTGADAEALVVRPKEVFDSATPSGNSAAAMLLLRLAHFTGEAEDERAGLSALRLVRDLMERAPTAFALALSGVDLFLSAAREVAIVGDPMAEETKALVRTVRARFTPNDVLAVGAAEDGREPRTPVPLLRDRPQLDGRATAYVCQGFVCRQPVTEPQQLAEQLRA